jgi:hypothetical protein
MAETKLSQYAMLGLGWPINMINTGPVSTEDFNLDDELGVVDQAKYSHIWAAWEGQEEEFYINCYNIIKETDAATFKSITGLSREILDAGLRIEQKNFSEGLFPDYLLLHPDLLVIKQDNGFTSLTLGENSLEVASVLLPIVRGFNGIRSTVEVFHLGYNVLVSIDHIVVDLLAKGMLINPENHKNIN